MNFELKFDSHKNNDLLILETKNYFVNHGFKLINFDNDFVEFDRGSIYMNKFIFNPLKWKSNTKISFRENGSVIAHFTIDLTNQVITIKEHMHWVNFIQNFKEKLTSETSDNYENQNKLNINKRISFLRLSKMFGFIMTLVMTLKIYSV